MNFLKFDGEQQRVLDYPGSCICIAGPGSGKTRTLVAKAEELYSEGKDLICLTFTRSAAGEMRERMPGIPAQTIHSFCYGEVGWDADYDKMLVDFQRMKTKPKFDWVLIDEVQDLTEDQLEVVLSIAKDKVFAVGDPYQSIYGFNGALGDRSISAFREFGCKELFLRSNYRSCPEVVDRLNRIYKRDLVSTGVKETGLTAILTRTNKDLREIEGILSSNALGYTITYGSNEVGRRKDKLCGNEKLRLMTCHCSKGLEFDWVVLYKWMPDRLDWECISGKHPEESFRYSKEEWNLFYVSMARASKGFCQARSSDEILDILRVGEEEGWIKMASPPVEGLDEDGE